MFDRQVQQMFYEKSKAPADLPWHREDPDRLFVAALGKRKAPGRALDVGCGTGVFSVYTAKHGYQVTGLDFMARAIEMARARADSQGVTVSTGSMPISSPGRRRTATTWSWIPPACTC